MRRSLPHNYPLNRGEEMDQIMGSAGKKRKIDEVGEPSIPLPTPTGNARGRSLYRLSTKKLSRVPVCAAIGTHHETCPREDGQEEPVRLVQL